MKVLRCALLWPPSSPPTCCGGSTRRRTRDATYRFRPSPTSHAADLTVRSSDPPILRAVAVSPHAPRPCSAPLRSVQIRILTPLEESEPDSSHCPPMRNLLCVHAYCLHVVAPQLPLACVPSGVARPCAVEIRRQEMTNPWIDIPGSSSD